MGRISDTYGIQAGTLLLVPLSVAAGLILSSAATFVAADTVAVRADSLARAQATAALGDELPTRS